jgi:hypothetical protein
MTSYSQANPSECWDATMRLREVNTRSVRCKMGSKHASLNMIRVSLKLQWQFMYRNNKFSTSCISWFDCKNSFSDQVITSRGCSTKRPVFYFECENHMSGLQIEQFCYCSFDLCNGNNFGCTANFCFCICASLMIIIIVSWWKIKWICSKENESFDLHILLNWNVD